MSSVEIDVKANTNQAERAMLELTRDVDKLVDKAKRLQDRRESDRKRIRDDVREMRVSQRKREQLKNEIYEQQKSVMITRGDKIVMFGKDASDSIKKKALKFINE